MFADWGYRPVDEAVLDEHMAKFPTPSGLFTIDDLGGWEKVNDEFFDPDKGSIAKIEKERGSPLPSEASTAPCRPSLASRGPVARRGPGAFGAGRRRRCG